MKTIDQLPLAFQPRYTNFVEENIKRRMIVSLMDGRNISLDLNKLPRADSFFDINIKDRMQISAIRLMVGRDVVTISRKQKNGEYIDGFFYYGMARTGLKGYSTMIEYEILGFCYNAKGDSVEFMYNYQDILRQLYHRNNKIQAINKEIQKAEEADNLDAMVILEEKIDKITSTRLAFNIERSQPKSNVLFVGYTVHLFYELTTEETLEFVNINVDLYDTYLGFDPLMRDRSKDDTDPENYVAEFEMLQRDERPQQFRWESDFAKYRKYVIAREQYHEAKKREPYREKQGKIKEPLKVESPFIPRLPFEGIAPKVLFRIRETGNI